MFSITKIFRIKDSSSTTVDIGAFLNSFYEKMIQGGHINSTVSIENFIPILRQIKVPFLDGNKLINQNTVALDINSVLWQADFDSAESYQEYKNALSNVFGTDFHLIIDTPNISLDIVA